MARYRKVIPEWVPDAAERYKGGESSVVISRSLADRGISVSPVQVRAHLRNSGTVIRTREEAGMLRRSGG